ncbi:MAG: hypothetical protein Q9176_005920 [Flavoplaca citrina]
MALKVALEGRLPIVTSALGGLLHGSRPGSCLATRKYQILLSLITTAGIVFRSELALFLIPHTLFLLATRRISIASITTSGILGSLIGLSVTVPIDSFFWQRFPLWPELSAFSYNILHSQSSNWGTSPWHFYFTSALPRLLFNPMTYILCIPLAASQPALRQPIAELVLPNLAFVTLYSLQPHKEWRFIIYTIPPFLTASALGANWIWTRRSKSMVYRLLSMGLIVSMLGSFAASGVMLTVSRLNYPGADALNRLHTIVPQQLSQERRQYPTGQGMERNMVSVHMDTLSCMTGITRFQQVPAPPIAELEDGSREKGFEGQEDLFWVYDKTEEEDKLLDPLFWERFDWVLAENPKRVIGRWVVVETVEGYAGLKVLRPGDDAVESDGRGVKDIGDMVRQRDVGGVWRVLQSYGRVFTRGWWLGVRMEPRVSILKRQRDLPVVPLGGDCLYDPDGSLVGGNWGRAVLELVELLGPQNVHLSVYEDDASPKAKAALEKMRAKIKAKSSLMSEHLPHEGIPRVMTPIGESKMKRIAFLAEVRNRALRPLQAKEAVHFDKLLYINDVMFNPIDAANLLFSTNHQPTGRTQYQAACATDFINAFKFYDRFALRDYEGYTSGIPFYPWFTNAGHGISRSDVLAQKDAVRVRACWGGMVAFEAKWFQTSPLGTGGNTSLTVNDDAGFNISPLRFRHEPDPFWEASECCLIHADLTYLSHGGDSAKASGIYMNPFVRVAYDQSTLGWLPYTRRVERLYSWVHTILNHLVGMPQYNPRRLERPGEKVVEQVWHYDEAASQSKGRPKGSYQQLERTAGPGRFCGIRRLMVMRPNPPKGQKNWENVPLPPEP